MILILISFTNSEIYYISQLVNGTRYARPVVEMLSPNQTKYTLTRTDPISRYRITLSARTQVGAGEVVTVDTPLRQDEGKRQILRDVHDTFYVGFHD